MPFNPSLKDILIVKKNLNYRSSFCNGEIDLLLVDGANKIIYVMEEKSTDTRSSRNKAKKQLTRIRDHLSETLNNQYTIRTYFLSNEVLDEYYPHTDTWDSGK